MSPPTQPEPIKINFNYQNKAFGFLDASQDGGRGTLSIHTEGSIPPNRASIGVGMNGTPVCAVQAMPNDNVSFVFHPRYYAAFGSFTKGEVLDVNKISDSVELRFDPGVYSLVVTLDKQFNWHVEDALSFNEKLLSGEKSLAGISQL
ncbi:hypothetical protein JOS77_30645 [Chromobacterium haemolyticum]|nr:hypothetical protein JOS77_30645 [Chromobacterium haemolyticum]